MDESLRGIEAHTSDANSLGQLSQVVDGQAWYANIRGHRLDMK
ncbi:hypothetical protein CSC43_6967 [Pseudomonas aeruginosa]|uniref:Uncharacterized protein n=1 Tax=Pseudomonas paraeruginosa TaxID=2994495 RepID=A0A2R3J616_9PSED|nr:hypothetical protein CSB93_6803 [Pseudomonas paraeruginosa]AWE95630.1 hypothetical protein CSC28_6633 [Pseudomonas paraeruginosa]AWE96376.1 hypothetical protein CSC26_7327 [Pseudomonas aeruginosa]RCH25285.1 hypothetical protein CSC43_6967 [Pseudomonas aeruginosa]